MMFLILNLLSLLFLFLVNKNDTQDLILKLENFLKLSNDERAQMGIAGRRKMEREFDRKIVVDAYMDVVHQIAEDKR